MFNDIKNIYKFSFVVQWTFSIILLKFCLVIDYILISSISLPIIFLLIPLLKTINHFGIAPVLKLVGFLHYYSPLLLIVKKKKHLWEIHGGNMFDFFINLKWKNKGIEAQKLIISDYLIGLLKIINEMESNKEKDIQLFGVSYILNQKNAKKLGFTVENVKLRRKLLFIIDYINLLIMYSFSKGRIAFPNIFQSIQITIKSGDLIKSKDKIYSLLNLINRKTNLIVTI